MIEQSIDIMLQALHQHDPLGWLPAAKDEAEILRWIAQNNGPVNLQNTVDRFEPAGTPCAS